VLAAEPRPPRVSTGTVSVCPAGAAKGRGGRSAALAALPGWLGERSAVLQSGHSTSLGSVPSAAAEKPPWRCPGFAGARRSPGMCRY